MAKNKTLVPLSGTVVVRDGQRVRPQIGKPFDFTAEEIEQLKAGGTKFREASDETEAAEAEPATGSSAEASQAKAKGGNKKATADKSDDENAAEKSDDDL